MEIINRLLNSAVFWAAWIIIPVIMEIAPAIGNMFILIKRHFVQKKKYEKPAIYPEISIIVPVYNSEDTLFECIKSINDSTYPNDRIRVFLVNNQGKDDSFSIYAKCQKEFSNLPMQWLNSQQGKSKALNLALYNSSGKYIINLDSDGRLEKSALTNMIDKFETNPELNCMTGVILTAPEEIEGYKGFLSKLLRKLEFMEYAQAFLAGRSYASEKNEVYTLSGAFSAFRKSAVLKSKLYNTDTICEDTQITFQMKYFYNERVEVCEKAIYFVDPIESVNKLYTQRQRWQRGSLEVAKMFSKDKFKLNRVFKDINIKTLMYDHTFAFPRMIWYLALICLLCMNYSSRAIVVATGIIMVLYVMIGYFYFISSQFFLKDTPKIRKYYWKQWWVVILLPVFNLVVFFIRLAGIINSINTDSAWKTKDLNDERAEFSKVVKEDMSAFLSGVAKVKSFVNKTGKVKERKVNPYGSKRPLWYVSVGLLYLVSVLIIVIVDWVNDTYGVGLNELLSTFTLTLKGTSNDVVIAGVKSCLPPVMLAVVAFVVLICLDRIKSIGIGQKVKKFVQKLVSFGAVVIFFYAVFFVNKSFDVVGYFKTSIAQTKIYDEYYVSPDDVSITLNGKKKI